MSHFVETMAYAGEIPWHRLGKHVGDELVDGKTMIVAAGLDWDVVKKPVFYRKNGEYSEIPGQFTTARVVDGVATSLGATVGARYTPFQNEALFEFGDVLMGLGGVKWHTAGSLLGGRKVWALAQVEGEIAIRRRSGKTDVSAPFVLLCNSHDGSSSILARNCFTRVVCWNTLTAALREGDVAEFRISHTANAPERAKEAAEILGHAIESTVAGAEVLQGLAETPMAKTDFVTFAAQILTGEDDGEAALEKVAKSTDRSKSIFTRKGDELVNLFERGKGNEGDSLLDGLNAITEFIDHQRQRVADWKTLADRAIGKGLPVGSLRLR